MSDGRFEARGDGLFLLHGEMSFATVPSLLEQSAGVILSGPGAVVIDLAEVSRADSAGLALLIHWMREAKRAGRSIAFRNVPTQLRAIADASDVERLLPIA